MRAPFAISLLCATFTLVGEARAHGIPGPSCARITDWSLGGSMAYASYPGLDDGVIYGVDAAFFPHCAIWAGGGVRVFDNLHASDRTILPYVEAGTWFLVTLGAGYTIDATQGHFAPNQGAGVHLFVGAPIPVSGSAYVEPYYRVTFLDDDALNEVGALLKWTTWDLEH